MFVTKSLQSSSSLFLTIKKNQDIVLCVTLSVSEQKQKNSKDDLLFLFCVFHSLKELELVNKCVHFKEPLNFERRGRHYGWPT